MSGGEWQGIESARNRKKIFSDGEICSRLFINKFLKMRKYDQNYCITSDRLYYIREFRGDVLVRNLSIKTRKRQGNGAGVVEAETDSSNG